MRALLAISLVVGSALLVGCNKATKDEVSMLTQENQQLTMQNKDLANALEAEKAERQRLEQNGATTAGTTTPAATAEATNSPALPSNLPAGVSAEWQGTELVLIIEGDVLFDSGKTSLKNNAMTTLDTLMATITKTYPNKKLRLEGFTDSDPIKKSGFKSNYHLAFERAYTVGQYMETKGFKGDEISYASFGAQEPRGSKAKSRRVEIAVVEAAPNAAAD